MRSVEVSYRPHLRSHLAMVLRDSDENKILPVGTTVPNEPFLWREKWIGVVYTWMSGLGEWFGLAC